MREWLSGGVSPCQGEGRGFESRLALFLFPAGGLLCQFSGLLFSSHLGSILNVGVC